MRSTHERHTIFKYRGQEKRDRRSSVKFSSERRLFRVRRSTKVEGRKNEAGSLCPKARICSRHVPQHVSHTRCHIRCSLHTYLQNCVSHAGCSQANPTRLDCVSSEPTNTRSTECACVCLFQYQRKDTFLARGARTIRSFQSPPRNRTDEKRKDDLSTSSELILFVHRPSPFLPPTTVILFSRSCLSSLSIS